MSRCRADIRSLNRGVASNVFRFKYGQRWGMLPTASHHKTHHTAPFEENWNFLNGLHAVLYEPAYFATGSSYNGLLVVFYTLNPACIQVLALATSM